MATESPLRFIGNEYNGAANWLLNKDASEFASSSNLSEDFGLLLKGKKYRGTKNNTGLSRSGSAPPSMEGSRAAFDILKTDGFGDSLVNSQNCGSEEESRAHPAYFAYYSENVNLNPRLPPPLVSHQNRHLREHIGGFENNRTSSFDDSCKASLAISRPVLSTHDEELEDDRSPKMQSSDWTDNKDDTAAGYFPPVQGHHMDAINLVQEDFPKTQDPGFNVYSHPSSDIMKLEASRDSFSNSLHDSSIGMANSETKRASHGFHGCTTHLGSQPVGLILNGDTGAMSVPLSASTEKTVSLLIGEHESNSGSTAMENAVSTSDVIKDEIQKLRFSTDSRRSHQSQQNSQQAGSHAQSSSHSQVVSKGVSYAQSTRDHLSHGQHGQLKLPSVDVQPLLQSAGVAPLLYLAGAGYGSPYYQNLQLPGIPSPQFNISGYALNPSLVTQLTTFPNHGAISLPFENLMGPNISTRAVGIPNAGSIFSGVDIQQVYKLYGHLGPSVQYPFTDPLYMPFCQHPSMDAYATAGHYDSTISRDGPGGHLSGTYDIAKASSSAYLADQRPQAPIVGINIPNTTNGVPVSPSYYGSPPNIGVLMQFPNSPLTTPVFQPSPVSTPSFAGQKNDNIKFPFGSERKAASSSGWQNKRGSEKVDSFLEELKSNRARRYELSDIVGHIVEFSADQHGSRFIQQKLETCSIDEKASVFKEVLPCASSLMIDVFGNYVIQKFFEHGSTEQRKELAYKLVGNVLPLSLQMYGCRVIQKALEVIELDQKTQLVQELDGNVIKCVRDQNGNHVVQKCIQCVPTEKIDFIISAFRGQVATLSTHPYGCRVIQRVLEHCTDESQSQFIVDEILQSACLLAQDQYGNYVTQHILEKGKPHERSQIISKLSGQILQMSQHKFASNVIEKCLEYGNTEERDQLINEIVGETEASDNLMVMMKDQYANYVVQKILDTCSDEQQEILVNRMKGHLQSLKKYTYGKHIVARVEQLCGEANAEAAPES